MIGFGIDEIQAEFVAEIKLRQLNREYILKRTDEIDSLKDDIADMENTLKVRSRLLSVIVNELKEVSKKYAQPRRSEVIIDDTPDEPEQEVQVADYAVRLFFTREGYFKKITPQSWRMSNEHKLKEGDEIVQEIETTNRAQLLFFSDKGQVYKAAAADFDDTKASVLGDFVAAKLGFDEGENAVYMAVTNDYKGFMFFAFENGKIAKVELSSYETKTKRKKLTGAYSVKVPLVGMVCSESDVTLMLKATSGRVMLLDTARIAAKSVRDTIGVQILTLKGKHTLESITPYVEGTLSNPHRFYSKTLPAAGSMLKQEDIMEQTTLE